MSDRRHALSLPLTFFIDAVGSGAVGCKRQPSTIRYVSTGMEDMLSHSSAVQGTESFIMPVKLKPFRGHFRAISFIPSSELRHLSQLSKTSFVNYSTLVQCEISAQAEGFSCWSDLGVLNYLQ